MSAGESEPGRSPAPTPTEGTRTVVKAGGTRRSYESPLRRQQAAVTRERILAAAAQMVHGFPTWDWGALTIRAVARRAEVNESTVYRYFSNERRLRDAVMHRLVQEAGVDLDGLTLESFGEVIGQMFEYLSSFPVNQPAVDEPTFVNMDERRRAALVAAVRAAAPDWSAAQAELAAAVLDVFWNVPSYERLTMVWNFDPSQAASAVTWLIRVMQAAIRAGDVPGGPAPEEPGAPRP